MINILLVWLIIFALSNILYYFLFGITKSFLSHGSIKTFNTNKYIINLSLILLFIVYVVLLSLNLIFVSSSVLRLYGSNLLNYVIAISISLILIIINNVFIVPALLKLNIYYNNKKLNVNIIKIYSSIYFILVLIYSLLFPQQFYYFSLKIYNLL